MHLEKWRNSLPTNMKWHDSDPPATDINTARMRAKYYGARYIIHRPLLYHALHYGATGARVGLAGARVGSVGQPAVDSPTGSASNLQGQNMSPSMTHTGHRAPGMSRMMSDLGNAPGNPMGWTPPSVAMRDLPYKLQQACRTCVASAIQSTEAFDGIADRLVVTNIFGTAHALVFLGLYNSILTDSYPGNLEICSSSPQPTSPVLGNWLIAPPWNDYSKERFASSSAARTFRPLSVQMPASSRRSTRSSSVRLQCFDFRGLSQMINCNLI